MTFDPNKARAQFPGLSRQKNGRPVVFLDNPAGTQVPISIVHRMNAAMLHFNANLGGFFDTSVEAQALVLDAHRAAAMFVNATDENEIFFGQSMTALTFQMACSIGHDFNAGDEIVLTRMDHDANVSPWLILAEQRGLQIRWLDFDAATFEFDLDALRDLISEKTRLVAVCQASNITGTINPIAEIARIAHTYGSLVYVDAVQFAAHGAIDVQALDCDFLVCSAYKFYGPHCAIFWGRRALLEKLPAYKVRPAPNALPWRFSLGTVNAEGLAGIHAAIEYIASLGDAESPTAPPALNRERIVAGFAATHAHDQALARRLIDGLQSLAGVRVLGITRREAMARRVATVSFGVDGREPVQIARALADEGIQVWSGHNYGIELYRKLGLLDHGGGVRIGAVHYNTIEEIDRAIEALRNS